MPYITHRQQNIVLLTQLVFSIKFKLSHAMLLGPLNLTQNWKSPSQDIVFVLWSLPSLVHEKMWPHRTQF